MAHTSPLASDHASPDAGPGPTPRPHKNTRLAGLGRAAAWVLGVAALALVFALYTHPTLRVALAEQVWACFN